MTSTLSHDTTFDPQYGRLARVSPLLRRLVARNPGLFTFTGSGSYVVGRGEVAVVDPGPADDDHIGALLAALDGERITHILITHTHRDHSGGAGLLAERAKAPTYGFAPHAQAAKGATQADVEEGADREFVPDIRLGDKDRIEGAGWTLDAMHTPGHTSNHLCFALPAENAVLTGDHVMAWSTTVIAPPDGDMTAYLASLEKMRDCGFATLWPTHGPPVHRPRAYIEALIAHRREREAAILRCLARGLDRIPGIVETLYADIPRALHPAAACSVLAHLIRLERQGRVATRGTPGLDSRYRLM